MGEPALILLHGFGGRLDEWEKIIPMFPENRVIALDLLGFGGSDRPAVSYDLETQRLYLQAFLEKLGVRRAVLAGRSMGASLAAWTAAISGEQTVGLVLIAPSAYPGSLTYPWPLSWIFKPGFWNQIGAFFVDNVFFRKLFPFSTAPQGVTVTRSYNSEFGAALKEIDQPTLLIWSKGDTTVPFRYSLAYLDSIPDVDLLEIPESVGHAVTRKYPEGTAAGMETFLAKLQNTSPRVAD
ncbi:alpha/beta fold hydrolase [Thermodesulfobacteriota bacterium]